jgi:hypothetical protein
LTYMYGKATVPPTSRLVSSQVPIHLKNLKSISITLY